MIASNRRNPQLRGLNVAAAFRKIDRAADLETFYRIIGPAKFYKYNFIANTDYGTIEFRQAEGHKDPVRAIDWIRIITQMVSTALGATRMEWARWAVIAGMGEAPEDLLGLEKEEWERWGMPEHLRLRAMSM